MKSYIVIAVVYLVVVIVCLLAGFKAGVDSVHVIEGRIDSIVISDNATPAHATVGDDL
jgi:hypothetical protein